MRDLELLEYLHDAVLEAITFTVADDGERTVRIRARAHRDCGYSPWSGMVVTVTLRDVVLFGGTLLGYTRPGETISIFEQGVSSEAENKLDELRRHGLELPPIKLGLALSSGSEIDLVCRDVDVDVEARG